MSSEHLKRRRQRQCDHQYKVRTRSESRLRLPRNSSVACSVLMQGRPGRRGRFHPSRARQGRLAQSTCTDDALSLIVRSSEEFWSLNIDGLSLGRRVVPSSVTAAHRRRAPTSCCRPDANFRSSRIRIDRAFAPCDGETPATRHMCPPIPEWILRRRAVESIIACWHPKLVQRAEQPRRHAAGFVLVMRLIRFAQFRAASQRNTAKSRHVITHRRGSTAALIYSGSGGLEGGGLGTYLR